MTSDIPEPTALLFVFGTLKDGFPNAASNRGRRLPGHFYTRDALPLYLVGPRHSPWLVLAPGEGQSVRGQLFEVDAEALAHMDRLERVQCADGYRRVEIRVVAEDHASEYTSFVYGKPAAQLQQADVRSGPLAEYTTEHAALYRPRDR